MNHIFNKKKKKEEDTNHVGIRMAVYNLGDYNCHVMEVLLLIYRAKYQAGFLNGILPIKII